jgi:Zn-dependent protease with chaperone function
LNHFEGRYYDGSSARATGVLVDVQRDGRLRIEGAGVSRELGLDGVSVSERLGTTPRTLRLPDGASVELPDSDALDEALRPVAVRGAPRFVFLLEQRWSMAAAAVVLTVLALFAAVQWGVPALADGVVRRLPRNVDEELGDRALDTLDAQVFEPSELDPEVRDALSARFDALGAIAQIEPPPRLVFRKGAAIRANVFALPSGIVVVTDELVALAEEDDDVPAVLAHELGHVHHRHGLRTVLRNVGVGVLVAGALGDFVSISALASTLPVLLLQLEYSRRFEREADEYGVALLRSAGVDPGHLADMLERLSGAESEWNAYFSTHPATQDRVAAIRRSR